MVFVLLDIIWDLIFLFNLTEKSSRVQGKQNGRISLFQFQTRKN